MRIRLFTFAVLSVQAFFVASAGIAADLYDNLSQPVSVDGNFSDGTWPALSFKTTLTDHILDSVTIPVRNPNLLTSGTISFVLYDSTGIGGAPGAAVGTPLGSVSIAGISGAGYQNVTFAGLNRTLTRDKHYWVAVQGAGLASVFYVGATTSTGGNHSGSLGFSISSDAGASWSAPSTSVFVIGQVTAVPEPSTYALGAIAALAAGWMARRKRSN